MWPNNPEDDTKHVSMQATPLGLTAQASKTEEHIGSEMLLEGNFSKIG